MKQGTGERRKREMKMEERIDTCRAECIAVLAVTGAIAQGLIQMDRRHHAAICAALDAAVRSLRSAAVNPDGSVDPVAIDALGLVTHLRDSVPPVQPQWPAANQAWGHA